jgi:hypothetical protein
MTAPLDYFDPNWRDHASCKGEDTAVFFFEDTSPNYRARELCITCPVRLDCLEYATEHEKDWGVWAGFTARVRLTFRRLVRNTRSSSVQELLVLHPNVVIDKYPPPRRIYRRNADKLSPISTNAMILSLMEAAKIREEAEKKQVSRKSEVLVSLSGSRPH